jgi:hypothetical protein
MKYHILQEAPLTSKKSSWKQENYLILHLTFAIAKTAIHPVVTLRLQDIFFRLDHVQDIFFT